MANNNHFDLALDTIAPSGKIEVASATSYTNKQVTLNITLDNASFMKVWFNNNKKGTKTDVGYPTSWSAAATTMQSAFTTDGVYYYHLVLMDDLGNESEVFDSTIIVYDVTKPIVSSVAIQGGAAITQRRTVSITFNFSGSPAAPTTAQISGDVNLAATEWDAQLTQDEVTAGTATRTIVLSGEGEEEATKTVGITVTDLAGNVSEKVNDSIILDTLFIKGDIVVRDRSNTNVINNQWVNYQAIKINLVLTPETGSDVIGYKVWGSVNTDASGNPTEEPTMYTSVTMGTNPIILDYYLTAGEQGQTYKKYIYAKVQDDALNETTLSPVLVNYDPSAPTVSIELKTGCIKYVSAVEGHTTTTFVPTVNCDNAGIKSYQWKMDGVSYPGGSGTTMPGEFVVDSTNMGTEEGSKMFTLTVTDNAGNITTSNEFEIVFDKTPPVPSAITMERWYNGEGADTTTYPHFANAGVVASASSTGAPVAQMACWSSTSPIDVSVPLSTPTISYYANPVHDDVDWNKAIQSATNYMHIKYIDQVGNSVFAHSSAWGLDEYPPDTTCKATFARSIYRTASAVVALSYSDAISGVEKFKIWGDICSEEHGAAITEQEAEWQAIGGSVSVFLTDNQEGTTSEDKTVYVRFKDVAGNYTTARVATTKRVTGDLVADLLLRTSDDSQQLPARTNQAHFNARVSSNSDPVKFQLYGDFSYDVQSAQGEVFDPDPTSEKWKDLTMISSIQQYMLVQNVYATSGDGDKNIYLVVMDNGQNMSEAAQQTFFYDTTPPNVTISGVDYNSVSKIHTLRRNTSGEIAGKYNDEVHFNFTPSQNIQAYKVCAYKTQALAAAGSAADPAIPSTAGSVNMQASGLNSDATVSCMIKGADFETALGGAGNDGAHYVVSYVQDIAGNWSGAAIFEVE